MFPLFTGVNLRNYRGFKSAGSIPLAPLTYLVGPNSAGKSSISNSIFLGAQSTIFPGMANPLGLVWSGSLTDLGSFPDVVYKHKSNLSLEIGYDLAFDPKVIPRWRMERDNKEINFTFKIRGYGETNEGIVRSVTVKDIVSGEEVIFETDKNSPRIYHARIQGINIAGKFRVLSTGYTDFYFFARRAMDRLLRQTDTNLRGRRAGLKRISEHLQARTGYSYFFGNIQRVTSGRSAPQRWYVPTEIQSRQSNLRQFSSVEPHMVEEAKQRYPIPRYRRPRIDTRKVLETSLRAMQIADKISVEQYSPYHSMIFVRDNITKITSNLSDVGYGASQAIPVISACATESQSPLIVEQPEIHLHPKAQGVIAEVLALTSLHRQVIIETHSAHFINKARILIASGKLSNSNVNIIYVDKNKNGSYFVEIGIDEDGNFTTEWPIGFFDERYEDTLTLLEMRSKK